MKNLLSILILLTIISCKKANNSSDQDERAHMKLHKEMDKVDQEYQKFEKVLIKLYSEAETNPEKVIIKADSLLEVNKSEKGKYRSQIRSNVESSLHRLKAELFYKLTKYSKSIIELETDNYISGDDAAGFAANYIKLKDYKKAKSFVDKIGKGYYIYDYALGNYYESIGEKKAAMKIYDSIIRDKRIKHYAYYKLAVGRFEELQKNNSNLLNEIYFPTGNPSFEICDSDNENISKIMELMQNLPENQDWAATTILETPQLNDKNYYWVRVKNQRGKKFDYYIYQQTFQIKYFNPISKQLMTLEDWRRSR